MEAVEILRTVAIGPPETRIIDVQRWRIFGVKGHLLRAAGGNLHWLLESDVPHGALEHAFLRRIAHVFDRSLDRDVG